MSGWDEQIDNWIRIVTASDTNRREKIQAIGSIEGFCRKHPFRCYDGPEKLWQIARSMPDPDLRDFILRTADRITRYLSSQNGESGCD